MPMKSYMAKNHEVEQKWHVVDADGMILGRMAAQIAKVLMGKNKPTYTPHADVGDYVIVVNAEKVRVTGKKPEQHIYDWYTRYPGGHKFASLSEMMEKKPEWVVEHAIRHMLPKTKMGKKLFGKLKVYCGPNHENQAQKPEKLQLS
jgi:large subunit ribosomal protein L13